MNPFRPVHAVKVGLVLLASVLMLNLNAARVSAQGGGQMPPLPGDLVVGDLQAPRGVAFDANGNLIVAVAGNGGSVELSVPSTEDPKQMMTVKAGMSGSVISVGKDGKSTPILPSLPSFATPTETLGVYRAIPHGDSLWLVNSGAGPGNYFADTVVELDAKTLNTKRIIPLMPFEVANNPDGNEIDSNASDIAWGADGTLYITDAGANALLSWTEKDGLKLVATWKENSVPTSVEVADNGDLYVGFLGAGLAPGAGKVEHWSGGKVVETFKGLNAVSDILLDGGTVYAVQLTVMSDKGPGPGSVVKVDAKGATPVAEGLITPFGIAKGPDGALYVSFGTISMGPGMTGGIVKLKAK